MTFVPGVKNLLDGHINSSPLGTLAEKTIDRLLAELTLSFFGWDQVRDRLAVARDRDGLAAFDRAEEFCELSLSLRSLYFAHCSTLNQSC
jgi:hypothetical protein